MQNSDLVFYYYTFIYLSDVASLYTVVFVLIGYAKKKPWPTICDDDDEVILYNQ